MTDYLYLIRKEECDETHTPLRIALKKSFLLIVSLGIQLRYRHSFYDVLASGALLPLLTLYSIHFKNQPILAICK